MTSTCKHVTKGCGPAEQSSPVQYSTVPCSTVRYENRTDMTLDWHFTVGHKLNSTALHCTALSCKIFGFWLQVNWGNFMQWLFTHRIPVFINSDLFLEYTLCLKLINWEGTESDLRDYNSKHIIFNYVRLSSQFLFIRPVEINIEGCFSFNHSFC